MNFRGMDPVRYCARVPTAARLVASLIVVSACALPAITSTETSTPAAPGAIASQAALPTSTPGSAVGATPLISPRQEPTGTATVPSPTVPSAKAPVVTLNGPFGSVDRDPSAPGVDWPDASDLEALDTWVHSAPLTLTIVDPDLTFAAWTISALPVPSPTSATPLETSPYPPLNPELLRVTGPPRGDWVLRADIAAAGRAAASYFWRLAVPDRDPPADGHVVVPAPHALLATSRAEVTGVPGSGCYVGACSDVGHPPVANALERLAGTSRGTLTLSLGDASRFVRWSIDARPVHDTAAEPATLERGHDPTGVDHAAFAAPGAGDWFVTISVTFDRRRGSYTWYVRLTIP